MTLLRPDRRTARAELEAAPLIPLFEDFPIEMFLVDGASLRCRHANRLARENLGYTAAELRDLTLADIAAETAFGDLRRQLAPLDGGRQTVLVLHTAWRRKCGTTYDVEVRVQLVHLNRAPAILAISNDISPQRRTEQALRQAIETAELNNRTKSEFLARMTHELRTPLNAIIGFSEIMRDELFGPLGSQTYRDYASDIHDSGSHLLSLINDILDHTKIEAQKYEIKEETVDPPQLVQETVRMMRLEASRRGVTLITECAAALPKFNADRRALRQIVLNLLSNAIRFTPEDGTVTVSAALAENGDLELAVADTGIGMSEADIPTALAPFGQLGEHSDSERRGTGLGLPIVKSLAELHGGSFEIESQPGQGTRVAIRLPASRATAARSALADVI